ncbi:hypothetical protein BCR34DRAFT_593772, partial [Clohesyomyces aquaticus]
MVYIPHIRGHKLTAYLTTTSPPSPTQLSLIHSSFSLGAYSRFPTPIAELHILANPSYASASLSHASMRRAESAAGSSAPFLVIDDETLTDGGVWYISDFATEDEVEDGEAESTDVLVKIRVRIEHVPVMHVNY